METERILLRHWQESDAEALFKYASDPEIGPHAGWSAHRSIKESLGIIQNFFNNDGTWAIVLKETGEAIGCIGYYTHEASNIPIGENDCEVGCWIGKPYWNKGICTEALKLVLDYCTKVKHFKNIWADHFLTSSLRHPKIFVKEFSYFLMPCHQHGLGVNLFVQR